MKAALIGQLFASNRTVKAWNNPTPLIFTLFLPHHIASLSRLNGHHCTTVLSPHQGLHLSYLCHSWPTSSISLYHLRPQLVKEHQQHPWQLSDTPQALPQTH